MYTKQCGEYTHWSRVKIEISWIFIFCLFFCLCWCLGFSPTDQQTYRPTDWLAECLIGEWLTDSLTDLLLNQPLSEWLTYQSIDWLSASLIDQSIGWLMWCHIPCPITLEYITVRVEYLWVFVPFIDGPYQSSSAISGSRDVIKAASNTESFNLSDFCNVWAATERAGTM